MNEKILAAEAKACRELHDFFEKEGYKPTYTDNGEEVLSLFDKYSPDIVFLDIDLHSKDGFRVCGELRAKTAKPIIVISERTELLDKVLALELGADDYITKPFDTRELAARIKAVLRRCTPSGIPAEETKKFDKLEISLQKYKLKLADKFVNIPPKELELLYCLASNANRVFTRDQLLDEVWGVDYLGYSRTVDVHIKRIREKIDGVSDKWSIKTVWGRGYKFELKE